MTRKNLSFFLSLSLAMPLLGQAQSSEPVSYMEHSDKNAQPIWETTKMRWWETTKKHWKKLTGALALMTTVAVGGFIANLEYKRRLALAQDRNERIKILKDESERYQKIVNSIETTILRYMPNGMNLQKGAQAQAQEYRDDIVEGILNRESSKYQEYIKDRQSLKRLVDEENWYYIQEEYFKNLFTNYWTIIQRRGNDQQKNVLANIMSENLSHK